ncbi:extracellular solute-binding protein [Paenibacillus koleovorans]|uniref:extracellular solute-binding protein n=1 Tax=Paenibacillus koleovorans TaxID=121608 RepID=UPI0013E3AA23|nr:extracellular solute-binding protein [Paenibacillus koleovorans]
MRKKLGASTIMHASLALTVAGLVLAGCSNEKEGGSEAAKNAPVNDKVNATGLPIAKEPMTIKMVVKKSDNDKTSWQEKESIKKAQQETGLKFEITEIPGMAWNEKIGIMIASNDLPDVIVGGIPNLSLYIDSFRPLNGLVDKYAPTLVKLYGKHPEYKVAGTLPDGNLYSLPLLQTTGNYANVAFSINKVWLDKLNLKVPTNTDELYQVLKAFKDKDPNGNGKADEIPYSFYNEQSYGLDPMLWNFGLMNDGQTNVMVDKGKVIFVPSDPRYYDYLVYLNKMYKDGLIDPDGFVQKNADYVAKGKKGVLGFFNHHSYDDIVVGTDKASEYIDILPMKDKSGNILALGNKVPGDFVYDAFVVTKKAQNPEALVRLYEYFNSSFDSRMLFSFGPENVVWSKVQGDKWEKATKLPTGFNNFAELRHTQSPGMNGFYLLMDEDNDRLNVTDPRDVKVKQKQTLYTPYLKKDVIPLGQDSAEVLKERTTMATEINTYLSNFLAQSIMKGIDDAGWKEHLDKLKKLNVDKYVSGYQQFYDRAQKLMGK